MAGFFGFFDYTKPGKGVSKEDVDKHGIALFFDILARRWGKLILLNIIYVLFSIPAILINWLVSGALITWLIGICGGPEAIAAATGIKPEEINLMFQFFSLLLTFSLLLILGSGSASAAMSYVIRKYVNDTHSWVWSDFWDNFKSNFFQGTVAYIINLVVFVFCIFALVFYNVWMGGILGTVVSTIVGIIFVLFLMMQMYVYQIMSGFKLKIKDIYRNALFLTIGKFPVNLIAAIFTAGVIYLYSLVLVYEISLIAVITVFYTLAVFIQIFITNNTVKKYLLEPSEKAADGGESEEKTEISEEE